MIAPAKPPRALETIAASEVAMNRALPSPHPARKATIPPIVSLVPASAAKITISTSPMIRVCLAPSRLETQLVTSIITAVTTR